MHIPHKITYFYAKYASLCNYNLKFGSIKKKS